MPGGPTAKAPAATIAVPTLSSTPAPPAEPAPPASSAMRCVTAGASGAPPIAAAQEANGSGVTTVAAARSVVRARCTSWRTAPSLTSRSRAIAARLCPSTAVRRSASRWLAGSAATPVSVSRITARRSRSTSTPGASRSESVSSS